MRLLWNVGIANANEFERECQQGHLVDFLSVSIDVLHAMGDMRLPNAYSVLAKI